MIDRRRYRHHQNHQRRIHNYVQTQWCQTISNIIITMITTNLTMNQLDTYLGQRTADRLAVLCGQPLNLGGGESYRTLQIEQGI